jgi:hypothetical protein
MNNDETTELGGRARRTAAAIAVLVAAARGRKRRRPTAHELGERRIRIVEIEDAESVHEQEPHS